MLRYYHIISQKWLIFHNLSGVTWHIIFLTNDRLCPWLCILQTFFRVIYIVFELNCRFLRQNSDDKWSWKKNRFYYSDYFYFYPHFYEANPAKKSRREKVGRAKWRYYWTWIRMLLRMGIESNFPSIPTALPRFPSLYTSLLLYNSLSFSPSLPLFLPSSFVNSVFAIYSLVGHCVRFTTQQNGSPLSLFALFYETPQTKFSRRGD